MKKTKKNNKTIFIYGNHPVEAALNNPNRECLKLYITKNFAEEKPSLSLLAKSKNIPLEIITGKDFQSILGSDAVHQNVALQTFPLAPFFIEDIVAKTKNNPSTCLLILDQITDPHNIGAIFRSAAAFGVSAIITTNDNSPEESDTLLKSASGGFELIPYIRVPNLANTINMLKNENFWIIGLDSKAELLNKITLPNKTAFIMGSESKGMRRLTRELCDNLVKIPINPQMESLNVSNAAAIILYEFYKQFS